MRRIPPTWRFPSLMLIVVFGLCAAAGQDPSAGHRKAIVLLDCYHNNEWKAGVDGVRTRWHYTWSDTANSGYSLLGGILSGIGMRPESLTDRPTEVRLKGAAVFILVDPDTPRETADVHYIDSADASVITSWVRDGGVLAVFANDRQNAEFEHLNRLTQEFGIRFIEDSRNAVKGADYGTGSFASLPVHPIFAGVQRIFMKEICTLSLSKHARPILTDSGDVIMAYARYGRGGVFAVGDPWFYNEYMDQRRLPDGFGNARAAKNLFQWLLHSSSR
jgi:unsaturated rhamnogalacturonyl hydrolase